MTAKIYVLQFFVTKRNEGRYSRAKEKFASALPMRGGFGLCIGKAVRYSVRGEKSALEQFAKMLAGCKPIISATDDTFFGYFAKRILSVVASYPDGADMDAITRKLAPSDSIGTEPSIPFKDKHTLLQKCVDSLVRRGSLHKADNKFTVDPSKEPDAWKCAEWSREANLLLDYFQTNLYEAETMLANSHSHWGGEDPFYRFFHGSFKVYYVQSQTEKIARFLGRAGDASFAAWKLNSQVARLLENGTGKGFEPSHNTAWETHTKPILDAFLYLREFLAMAVKYAKELSEASNSLPSGWASLLYYYGKR